MYVFSIMFSVGTGGIYNLAHLNKTLNFKYRGLVRFQLHEKQNNTKRFLVLYPWKRLT